MRLVISVPLFITYNFYFGPIKRQRRFVCIMGNVIGDSCSIHNLCELFLFSSRKMLDFLYRIAIVSRYAIPVFVVVLFILKINDIV